MKLKTLAILLTFFQLLLVTCSKESENKYSCDDEINNFVTDNKDELAELSYNEILTYNLESQKAIFRLMSPDKRFEMWNGKLSWTISHGALTENQQLHIQYLLNSIKPSWFDENFLAIEENSTLVQDFYTSWFATSVNDFEFSENILYSIIVNLDIYDDPFNNLNSGRNKIDVNTNNDFKTDGTGTCGCSQTSDWCDSGMGGAIAHCADSECVSSSLGCGTLWTFTCDGDCELGSNPGDM